jgi:hypothetical protein
MIQALLVDLDDTLLENDFGQFIPAYFDLLASELTAFGPKEEILGAILAGTKAMLGNEDPERTLPAPLRVLSDSHRRRSERRRGRPRAFLP